MLDANLVFSDGQAVTVSAASTNKLDLGAYRGYVGQGDDLVINVVVDTAFANATSMKAALQGCDTEGGSYEDVVVGPVIAEAGLVKGKTMLCVTLPKKMFMAAGNEMRYFQVYYTVVGTHNAGAVNAFLTLQKGQTTERRVS